MFGKIFLIAGNIYALKNYCVRLYEKITKEFVKLDKYICGDFYRAIKRTLLSLKGEKMENKLLMISERSRLEVMELLPDEGVTNRLALYFQNFSDQTRIRILSALSIRELCVNDLSKVLDRKSVV